ncbi:Limbin [Galemys pyrenaicus]|uniref:Limbin n=1 Tax=Galemys pyrenaicus TaxID=202257 RepID=A0A8J5ZR39_GALPY|nr:Limbin [Galemys pyrenaicus]
MVLCGPPRVLSPAASVLQHGEPSGEVQAAPENGVIFQKCAVVSGPEDAPTAQVQLLVNNTRAPAAASLSDLLLLDNVSGLSVRGWPGNRTADGLQVLRRPFLQVGEAFLVSYTASLDAGGLVSGTVLTLPARLSFQTPPTDTVTQDQGLPVASLSLGHLAAADLVCSLHSLRVSWAQTWPPSRSGCASPSSRPGEQ